MPTSHIKALIDNDIQKVWEVVFNVEKYKLWRSDLSQTEIINKNNLLSTLKNILLLLLLLLL